DTMYDKRLEPWEPNLTTLVDFNHKAWVSMIEEDVPVPTPVTEEYRDKVGVFEGGGYAAKGIYRPAQQCLMNSFRGVESFCPVCQQAIESYVEFLCR
ncbi:MAG: peptidase M64, partial [Alistipes sp.]|nr:peptidase M64 [Alistipes sp.]